MISLETPQGKWASSRLEGRISWIFSSCGRCSRLTTGTSGTRSGGLRIGQSPCELLGGLSGFLSSADMDLGVLLESPQWSQSSSPVGACTCAFLPSCSSSVTIPRRGPRDLWLWLEAFPRGCPTGLSHVPPWCESILGLKVEAMQGKQVCLNGLRHLGDSGNGGTTLEFLSPFLWRAPPLEMRRERREFFPYHAGTGSRLSS